MQKLIAAVIVLHVSALVNSITLPDARYLANGFGDYQARFAKKYSSSDELSYRRIVYEANLQEIADFNAQDNDWRKGENMFTDLTPEERDKYLGLNTNVDGQESTDDNDQEAIVATEGTNTEDITRAAEIADAENSIPVLSGQVTWKNTYNNSSNNNYSSYSTYNNSTNTYPYSTNNSSNNFNNNNTSNNSNNTNNNGTFNNSNNISPNSTNNKSNSSSNINNSSSNSTTNNSANKSSGSSANNSNSSNSPTFSNIQQNVNWVTANAVSPVKNQGQCGGCYAFSTAALVESLYMQKFKASINLSEQEVIDCSSSGSSNVNSGCNGGLINYALSYYQDKGVHLESAYPYIASMSSCRNLDTVQSAATAAMSTSTSATTAIRVSGIKEVGRQSLLDLLVALQTSPVSLGMFVPQSLYSYQAGLFNVSNCSNIPSSSPLNHAVLAVGYSLTGDNSTNNKPYLLIKNSWGTTWGEQGYFKLEMPLVDAGNGPCNTTYGGYNFTASLV